MERNNMKYPGQDMRYWKHDAIFEVKCPQCRTAVEFFKDDPFRICSQCGLIFSNPKLDYGCASYCKYAEQCLAGIILNAAEGCKQTIDFVYC